MSNVMLLQEPETQQYPLKPMYEEAVDISGNRVKKLKIFGTAIVCDIPGINGRSYPRNILEAEVKRFNEKFIRRGRAIAELNHPRLSAEGEGKDYSVFEMNLMKTCAVIEELYFEGNNLFCKMAVVENHPAGQALKALLESGYVPGYSLRGAGSVVDTNRGYYEVAEDYRLITIDVVGNPSFDDKALISSMYESVKQQKMSVLTESVDIAAKEYLINREEKMSLMAGRKKFNKAAVESYFRKMSGLMG